MRISNSFSEGEIQVLEFIVQTLLRGGTPTMATRHKEFASLCRKVMAMKGKVNEQKPALRRAVPDESSVGTVASPDRHDAEIALDADQSDAGDKDLAAVG
jgi:hypothetical protein